MQIFLDNVQSLLVGSETLFKALRKYMSIDVPGAYFTDAYRKHGWDGKRYFITPKGNMATGFLPLVLKYIEEEYPETNIEIIDKRGEIPRQKEVFIEKIGSVAAASKYEYQKELIVKFNNFISFRNQSIYFPRGIVDAATNAGKTAIMAGLYLNLEGVNRMLVIIHRKTIYRELVEFMTSVFGEVGEINPDIYKIAPVTIGMINTMHSRLHDVNMRRDLESFNILVVDESHRAGSSMYSKVLQRCPSPIRMFLSGTALDAGKDAIVKKMIMVGLSGPKLGEISKRELMDKKISTEVKVHLHVCNTILRAPIVDYKEMMKACVHYSSERVALMWFIIKQKYKDGLILVAVNEIHHGEFLLNRLQEFNDADKLGLAIDLTHSEDSRQIEKVDACKQGDLDVLISTTVLKEGVNIPLVRYLIYAAGGKSKIDIKQWMGRIERLHSTKPFVEFHDFYDIGSYIQRHSAVRRQIYIDEQLEIIEEYNIKEIKKYKSVVIN